MEEKDLEEIWRENESEEETLGTSEESLEETADEMPDEVPEDTERFEAEAEEISGETEEEEFHFVRAEDENPFADDSEGKQTKASVWNLRKKSWNVPER